MYYLSTGWRNQQIPQQDVNDFLLEDNEQKFLSALQFLSEERERKCTLNDDENFRL